MAEELAFLARYQREDGKITHEISQAAAHIDWFGSYPYAYYHADTTPYWMFALYQYWRASGDDDLLRELWPAYRRAWAWCLTAETDGDGIIENTVGGLGAVEVGGLGEALHQDVYLAGVWVAALEGTLAMAERMADRELAAAAARIAPVARRTLNRDYWREAEGHHAFGILAGGGTNDNLTVWPATAAAFGLLDGERARSTMTRLASDRISSDWGAHMLSTESELYDPLQYNMGTVWPFVTGFAAWGQVPLPPPLGGLPPDGCGQADDVRLEPGASRRTLLGDLLPAAGPDRAAPVLRQLHARHSVVERCLRVGAGRAAGRARGWRRSCPRTGRARRCDDCVPARPCWMSRSASGGWRMGASGVP